jgi:hypothetical protein
LQLLLFRYKEEKIFRELERIEFERQQIEVEKMMKRQKEMRLREYNE